MPKTEQYEFKGIRNDYGDKLTPKEYVFDSLNFNNDDIVGINKIKAPAAVNKIEYERTKAIDGYIRFKYLDTDNKTKNQDIIVSGGKVFKGLFNPTEIYDGLTEGLVDFCIHRDELYITNGKNFPLIYDGSVFREMGAPKAEMLATAGLLTGAYYYAMTYVTAGGEEVIGTVSDTISPGLKQVKLTLNVGYSGTTSRKIYRTVSGGTTLKLLTTIADNTTLTYTDNIADGSLTTEIPDINNEMPKPYFIESNNFKLVGVGADKYPTQAFIGGTNDQLWDAANFLDISNRSKDNSPLIGMEQDYKFIIVASEKQIYVLDTSGTPSSTLTRANVGCLNGYSMQRMPANGTFPGGVLFLASDRTIRLFNGNFAQPVATSLDNLTTENWGQPIKNFIDKVAKGNLEAYSAYFDFKYHLIVNNIILVFDTRTLSWWKYSFANDVTVTGYYDEDYYNPDFFAVGIKTNATFNYMAVAGNKFYIGRKDASLIEEMYQDIQYRGTDLSAQIEFPYWLANEDLSYIKEVRVFYKKSPDLSFQVKLEYGLISNKNEYDIIDISTEYYDENYYNSLYFKTGESTEDYKTIYVNKYVKWIKPTIISNENPLLFRGISIIDQKITNKETA